MSDHSDREEDGLSSTDQDSDASEIKLDDGFFDLEADESDGHDGDGNEDGDDEPDASESYSFPQFSRLPPELRTMIWEAVDPDLKCQGRVIDFLVVSENGPLWPSPTLEQQTAPARALLAATQESRYIALAHYPDVIDMEANGIVRFRSSSDVILIRPHDYLEEILYRLGRWCDKIRYLAFGVEDSFTRSPSWDWMSFDLRPLPEGCRNLEAIFYCFEGYELGIRRLGWSVSKTAKKYYSEAFEDLGVNEFEECSALYCWPDTTLQDDSADWAGDSYPSKLPHMPRIGPVPIWPMAKFSFESGIELYRKAKRYAKRSVERGVASSSESSGGESIYDSPEDYELDGFIVGSSEEESEDFSGDEDDELDDVDIHRANDSGEDDDPFDGNEVEEDARFDHSTEVFNGFSPLQDPSDDEAASHLPNITQAIDEPGSPEDLGSDASSLGDEPRATRRPSRRKRRIVSSDDEDDGENGDAFAVKSDSRGKKRARVEISDSEDGEDGDGDGAGSEVKGSCQPRKRARTVVSGNEDAEGDEDKETEEEEDEEDEDDDDDDDDDDDEEEPRASKPISLLAKLRQFRSEVRVSPENESSGSGEDYDEEEKDEFDEEEHVSDAEFPESSEEDAEANGW
ncbi:hypothetical protein F5B17DRAFT_421910 [Nemania serpens]|nr:hypothetical protein F5B17DRAFT_421910 [Nemania serpens]